MDSMDPNDPLDSLDSLDDDFEIEVTDLNTGAPAPHPFAGNSPGGLGETDAPDDGGDDGDWAAPQASSPLRRRQTRAAIVTGVVALAVALVILINPAAQSSLYTVFRFPTPAPSPTPLPGRNMVYLAHGAPWGDVTLDGKSVKDANLGMNIVWITIPHGRHTLTVTQAPFPTVRCVISTPASTRDTCPLFSPFDSQYPQIDPNVVQAGSRFIDLGARFSKLPQADQDALLAAATADLQPSSAPVTIHPGDHYLRDDGVVAVAQTPLVATFIATILPPAASVASDSSSCVSFCDITGITIGGNATWNMRVSLIGTWQITTPIGKIVSQSAPMFPADPIYQGMPATIETQLSMLWTGRWQVSVYDTIGYGWSPACEMAQTMLETRQATVNVDTTGTSAQSGRTAEDGCVISVTLASDPANSTPLYFYYRFGVLLAANDIAHQTLPDLPVASASERALARQLLAESNTP